MPRARFFKLSATRRDEILQTAAGEFAHHDYDSASLNRIIASAGLSKGAFYYYFDDKEDLFHSVATLAVDRMMGTLGDIGAPASQDQFWDRLLLTYVDVSDFYRRDPTAAALGLLLSSVSNAQVRNSPLAELTRRSRKWFEEVLSLGQELGAVRRDLDLDLMVEMTMALTEAGDRWLVSHWDRVHVADSQELAVLSLSLLRRLVAPEKEGS